MPGRQPMTDSHRSMALERLHGLVAKVRLPSRQRWHPPGYVPMRQAWLVLMLNAAKWQLPGSFLRPAVNAAIAEQLTGWLASGDIRIAGLHCGSARGRFWWAPMETWEGTARVVLSRQKAVLAALKNRSLVFPMPDGSRASFIPFIAERDLATAMGAK